MKGIRSRIAAISWLSLAILLPHFGWCDDAAVADKEAPVRREKLSSGTFRLNFVVGTEHRTALVHVPGSYEADRPTPLVVALHGATMDGVVMMLFTGLNETADQKGFIVVYPDGAGIKPLLTWNAGGFKGFGSRADDIAFLKQLLDELETVLSIDPKRTYACGMSNGAMMCYRVAAEMSDRIAAIAPVGGTMPIADVQPTRPVSVIHFHGTQDTFVPIDVGVKQPNLVLRVKSAEESVLAWAKLDGCDTVPARVDMLSKEGDEMPVTRSTYGPGKDDSEAVFIKIEGGGHTWPGQPPPVKLIGKSAMNISANDLLWAFFEKHKMK